MSKAAARTDPRDRESRENRKSLSWNAFGILGAQESAPRFGGIFATVMAKTPEWAGGKAGAYERCLNSAGWIPYWDILEWKFL